MKQPITELQALQNMADAIKMNGLLEVNEMQFADKRRAVKYYLTCNVISISPVLDSDQLIHFMLGMIEMSKYFTK